MLTAGPDGSRKPGNLFEQEAPPREFVIYGCKARYTIRGLPEISLLTESEARHCLVSTLRRFNIALTGDGKHVLPAFDSRGITSVPWKGKCELRLTRSGFSLGGFFFGDSALYLPVLCELAIDALGIDRASAAAATTEMSYGVEILLDAATSRRLIRQLETTEGWVRNARHDFIATKMEGALDFYETTVDLATERIAVLCGLFHSGLLRPVEAIPLAENHFLGTITAFPLPVRLLPLGDELSSVFDW